MTDEDASGLIAARRLDLFDEYHRDHDNHSGGRDTLLARTTTIASYPTAAATFYALLPLVLTGAEVEGGPGTVTPAIAAAAFLAWNLGSAVPPSGTQVVATFVGNRWAFRYDG